MAEAGEVLEGRAGFQLRLIQTAAETDGELLEMEATYSGDGQYPPVHMHPNQLERFEVLEGAVLTIVDGVERRYEPGDTFEVPAGTPHQMKGDGPAKTLWQVRPALRTAEFFERVFAQAAGDPAEEGVNLFEEFSDEIRLILE
jgi:quercetin dioxygenase-like cupin family protein